MIKLPPPRAKNEQIKLVRPAQPIISPKKTARKARTEAAPRRKRAREATSRGSVGNEHSAIGDAPGVGIPGAAEAYVGNNMECYTAAISDFDAEDFEEEMTEGLAGYDEYEENVLAECIDFSQIGANVCVVQGWDPRRREATVCFVESRWFYVPLICRQRAWYHLDFRLIGTRLEVACMCKLGTTGHACVHTAFFDVWQTAKFPLDKAVASCCE